MALFFLQRGAGLGSREVRECRGKGDTLWRAVLGNGWATPIPCDRLRWQAGHSKAYAFETLAGPRREKRRKLSTFDDADDRLDGLLSQVIERVRRRRAFDAASAAVLFR